MDAKRKGFIASVCAKVKRGNVRRNLVAFIRGPFLGRTGVHQLKKHMTSATQIVHLQSVAASGKKARRKASPVRTESVDVGLISDTRKERQELLMDIANMREDGRAISQFWTKWKKILHSETPESIEFLRSELQRVWAEQSVDEANKVLNKWLAWRPSAEEYERYRSEVGPVLISGSGPADYLPFECVIQIGGMWPYILGLRANLIQGVFENWKRLTICRNQDCVVRYFIAKRKDQKVCDAGVCKAERHREKMTKFHLEAKAAKKKK